MLRVTISSRATTDSHNHFFIEFIGILEQVNVRSTSGFKQIIFARIEFIIHINRSLIITFHVFTLVQTVFHQAEAGIVTRIASQIRGYFGSILCGKFQIIRNPLSHFIQRRAHGIRQRFRINYFFGIQDYRYGTVNMQQEVHHQSTTQTCFSK